MKMTLAKSTDAFVIHCLMIQAFSEYKDEMPPSSALEETVQSIALALEEGEQAIICTMNEKPVGMVRFRMYENDVYFYRLSVLPEMQGQGLAKKLLQSLESYALEQGKNGVRCKVRMNVSKNIHLYRSIGYNIYDEKTISKSNGLSLQVASMQKKL